MAELESKIMAQVNVMDKVMGKLEKQLTTFSNTLNQLNKGGLKGFAKGIEDLASAMQTVKGSAPTGEKGAEGGSNDAAVGENTVNGFDFAGLTETLGVMTAGLWDAAGAFVTDIGNQVMKEITDPVKANIVDKLVEQIKGKGKMMADAGKEMGNIFYSGFQVVVGNKNYSEAFTGVSSAMKNIAGIAAIIGGTTLAVTSFFSMWENGFSWLNEALMLIGIAIAAVGAVILGAGVGITAGVVAVVAGIVAAIATVAVLIHDNWDVICEWFSGVAEWFNVNVIIPVVTFFSGLWTTVSGFFLNLWNDIVAIWQMVSTWFSETVIEPVAAAFEFFKARICQVFEGLWIIIQAVWQLVSGWFNEHVITPVADLFSGLKTKISEIFQNVVSFVQGVWNTVSSWFNEHVITPVSNLFTDLKTKISDAFQSAVSFVLGVWNTISSWMNDHVIAPISNLFWSLYGTISGIADKIGGAIRGALAGAINTAISGVESGINLIINGINNVIKGFNKVVKWAAKIAKTSWDGIELIPTVSLNRIPGYAMGGFPQKASLFWAGELGVPELIGTVGGKTAVAGGEEITGIRDEIRSSGMTEAQLLKTAIGLLRVIAEKDTTISSDDLFRSIQSSSRNYSRRTGRAAFDF